MLLVNHYAHNCIILAKFSDKSVIKPKKNLRKHLLAIGYCGKYKEGAWDFAVIDLQSRSHVALTVPTTHTHTQTVQKEIENTKLTNVT